MLFLQIIGAIFVALLLIIGLGFLYFRRKVRSLMQDFDEDPTPLIIHLNQELKAPWLEQEPIATMCDELEQLGFKRGHSYSTLEMSKLKLIPFEKSPLLAVVYQFDGVGSWVDVVFDEVDGNEYTFSNAPMGAGTEKRPECVAHLNANSTLTELVETALVQVEESNAPIKTVSLDSFRESFEATYKKDMAWTCRKGGTSYSEMLATAAEQGTEYTEEEMTAAYTQLKEDELFKWEQAALEHYEATQSDDKEAFYEVIDRLVVVPFTTDPKALINYLSEHCFLNEEQAEYAAEAYDKQTDAFSLFDTLNNMLSPSIRAKQIAELDFPLKAKMYEIHESMM
jgi:hypothetical protein